MFQIFADEDESYRAAKVVLCIVVAGFTLAALLGCSAKADEEITAAAEREAYEKKITYRLPDGSRFEAELPIQYTFKSQQCSYSKGCKPVRYYFPRGK